MDFVAAHYLAIKALHIIAVISWMAGLLYLPRLFAYHSDAVTGSVQSETFKTMERRLLRGIMNPALVVAFITGSFLIAATGFPATDLWVWLKAGAVAGLVGVHMLLAGWRRIFEADANTRSARFYKIINEIPTVMMIVIVFMVVTKPF